jgi:hypothetical protein
MGSGSVIIPAEDIILPNTARPESESQEDKQKAEAQVFHNEWGRVNGTVSVKGQI